MISRGFFDHFMTFVSQLVGIGGHIARSIKTFEKGLHAIFSIPIFPSRPIRLISPIRPIHFLTWPNRPCKRATLRSSFGPNENLKEPLLQGWKAF